MKDDFKRKLHENCDVGGFRCSCCDNYFDKDKYKLNKLARTQLKNEDRRLFKDETFIRENMER